jgi:hypothetical protein
MHDREPELVAVGRLKRAALAEAGGQVRARVALMGGSLRDRLRRPQ